MRIKQEIVLGIGGVRALEATNIAPTVFHMNEGHSAFLALERIRVLLQGTTLTFDEARQQVMATNVFTTHTPVPAGIDFFSPELMLKYFHSYYPGLKLDEEVFLAHERSRSRLVSWARQTLKEQLVRRGASYDDVAIADQVLDPDALTIGFARRFATYKRGTLLLRDVDRLKKLVSNTDRP